MAVVKANTATFDSVVKGSDKVVFVDFNAVWCGPCKMFAPTFEKFSETNSSTTLCVSVDIDESRDVAMRYGIQAVPTILVFKNGEIVDSIVGATDARTLNDKLSRHS